MSATKHIIHDLVLTNEPVGHIVTQAINFGHAQLHVGCHNFKLFPLKAVRTLQILAWTLS
jgi:hypothetical protein